MMVEIGPPAPTHKSTIQGKWQTKGSVPVSTKELDSLLCGAAGITVKLTDGQRLSVTRHELATPSLFRLAMWQQTGYRCPRHTQAEHDDVIRVLCAIADADELTPAA